MAHKKIGKGYYQSGYGRGFKKSPVVWLVNGKAYVKDSKSLPFETDIKGLTMVNQMKIGEDTTFYAVGLTKDHKPFLTPLT